MTKKILAIVLAVMMVLLTGCSTIPADEKESAEEILTVSFPAGNETESTDSSTAKTEEPTSTAAENSVPAETEPAETTSNITSQPESGKPQQEEKPASSGQTTTPSSSGNQETTPPETTPPTVKPQEPKPTEPPTTTPKEEPVEETPVTPEPTQPPEPEKPKSAYDYEFDIGTIKQELIGIGTGMGLTVDGSLTPSNSSWANPVTASQSFQGSALERSLKDYVRSMPSVITAFGGEPIQYFSIYVEKVGGGSYCFYFLY